MRLIVLLHVLLVVFTLTRELYTITISRSLSTKSFFEVCVLIRLGGRRVVGATFNLLLGSKKGPLFFFRIL